MPSPNHPIEAVLFDLDGTLLDTACDLAQALNLLLVREGKNALPVETTRKVVSNGGNAMVSLGFGTKMGEPEHKRLYLELLDIYGRDLASHTRPFVGIESLLAHLDAKGLPWGVVTNKPRAYSVPLLEAMNLAPPLSVLVCPDDVAQKKPHPEPMFLACSILDCDPARTLYVGDHRRDIEAGRNAGMLTAAALYGYIDDNEDPANWQADYNIRHANELIPVINTLT
ncbi:MAG: HAD-IA family hydrolase [Pseudomonadales bacterium]|jgi:phosphoglycolate phosphatase